MPNVNFYRAIEVGAPSLSGNAGSLFAVVDSCLRTGFGARSGAGWTLEFSVGNLGVWRAPAGNRMYLRVDDEVVGKHRLGQAMAFEVMTDESNGFNMFPTTAQTITGLSILKSDIEDNSAPRDWLVLANDRTFYLITNWNNQVGNPNAHFFGFGDFNSFNANDDFNTFIFGKKDQVFTINNDTNPFYNYSTVANTIEGLYCARAYTQLGYGIKLGKHGDSNKVGCQFPNPVDGGIYYSPIWLTEPNVVRGILPGVWYVPHDMNLFTHGDTFLGSGEHLGKTFFLCRTHQSLVALEISDTW